VYFQAHTREPDASDHGIGSIRIQPLHVRGGVFHGWNSLAWRIILPVPSRF